MRRGLADMSAAATEQEIQAARERIGELSSAQSRVVVIADLDMAMDDFFAIRSRVDRRRDDQSMRRALAETGNVSVVANALDVLLGHDELMSVRTRRSRQRPLQRIEAVRLSTEEHIRAVTAEADQRQEQQLTSAQDELDQRLAAIEARADLDAFGKTNLLRATTTAGEAEQKRLSARIEQERDRAIKQARSQQRQTIRQQRDYVRVMAVGVPAACIFAIVLLVVLLRLWRERVDIPTSRRRRNA